MPNPTKYGQGMVWKEKDKWIKKITLVIFPRMSLVPFWWLKWLLRVERKWWKDRMDQTKVFHIWTNSPLFPSKQTWAWSIDDNQKKSQCLAFPWVGVKNWKRDQEWPPLTQNFLEYLPPQISDSFRISNLFISRIRYCLETRKTYEGIFSVPFWSAKLSNVTFNKDEY